MLTILRPGYTELAPPIFVDRHRLTQPLTRAHERTAGNRQDDDVPTRARHRAFLAAYVRL